MKPTAIALLLVVALSPALAKEDEEWPKKGDVVRIPIQIMMAVSGTTLAYHQIPLDHLSCEYSANCHYVLKRCEKLRVERIHRKEKWIVLEPDLADSLYFSLRGEWRSLLMREEEHDKCVNTAYFLPGPGFKLIPMKYPSTWNVVSKDAD